MYLCTRSAGRPLAAQQSVFSSISTKFTVQLRLIPSDSTDEPTVLSDWLRHSEWKLLTPHVVSFLKDQSFQLELLRLWSLRQSSAGDREAETRNSRPLWCSDSYRKVNTLQKVRHTHRCIHKDQILAPVVRDVITGEWIKVELERCLKRELSCRIRAALKR